MFLKFDRLVRARSEGSPIIIFPNPPPPHTHTYNCYRKDIISPHITEYLHSLMMHIAACIAVFHVASVRLLISNFHYTRGHGCQIGLF